MDFLEQNRKGKFSTASTGLKIEIKDIYHLMNRITRQQQQKLDAIYKQVFRDPNVLYKPQAGPIFESFWIILQNTLDRLLTLNIDPIILGTSPAVWDGIGSRDWLALCVGKWSAGQRRFSTDETLRYDRNGQIICFDPDLLEGIKLSYLACNEPKNGYSKESETQFIKNFTWPKGVELAYHALQELENQGWRNLCMATFGRPTENPFEWYMDEYLILVIQNKIPWLIFSNEVYTLWNHEKPLQYFGTLGDTSELSVWDFGPHRFICSEEHANYFDCLKYYKNFHKKPKLRFFIEDPRVIVDGKTLGHMEGAKEVSP